jgi:hypothetical protein
MQELDGKLFTHSKKRQSKTCFSYGSWSPMTWTAGLTPQLLQVSTHPSWVQAFYPPPSGVEKQKAEMCLRATDPCN